MSVRGRSTRALTSHRFFLRKACLGRVRWQSMCPVGAIVTYISGNRLTFIDPRASKRVCIIAAGGNGLATLKILAETHEVQLGLWKPVAFEERNNVGGIWYNLQHPSFPITFFKDF